jgi:hypothetical protein
MRRCYLAIVVHKQWLIIATVSCRKHELVQHAHRVDDALGYLGGAHEQPRVVYVEGVALALAQDDSSKLKRGLERDILPAQTAPPDDSHAVPKKLPDTKGPLISHCDR